jgi:GIY-YIG catalytic domain
VLAMASEDDPKLTAWMHARLCVIAVPAPGTDDLGQLETTVLDILDPPLNLQGRPPSPARAALSSLRHQRTSSGTP